MLTFQTFMLPYLPEHGRFDDAQVALLLAEDHLELVHFTSHFFDTGDPCCAVSLAYKRKRPRRPSNDRLEPNARVATQISAPAEVASPPSNLVAVAPAKSSDKQLVIIAEKDQPLYEALRLWRNERSKREGLPAYIYFRNEQLATVARLRPKTKEELKRISGIGSVKVNKYGDAVLGAVRRFQPESSQPQPQPTASEEDRQ